MSGTLVKTATRILSDVVGKDFTDAGHLASCAGIELVIHRSGTLIRSEHRPREGNKRLKRALFRLVSLRYNYPASRMCYDRKRAQRKRQHQSLIALAPRRPAELYAILRDGTSDQDRTTTQAPAAITLGT